jgi:hypothetical protein
MYVSLDLFAQGLHIANEIKPFSSCVIGEKKMLCSILLRQY